MTPGALQGRLRQLGDEAVQRGWAEASLAIGRAEQAAAAGHFTGHGRWYRQTRKTLVKLARAALDLHAAAAHAETVARTPAPTAADLVATLPADPAALAADLRTWAAEHAYKDETDEFLAGAAELDQAAETIERTAQAAQTLRDRTQTGADEGRQAAGEALALIDGLVAEAAHYAQPPI